MICQKCKKEFPEKEIELSHDIPKYLGGTDVDGRHYLCSECHDTYEKSIISQCWIRVYKHLVSFNTDRRFLIPYITKLKNENNSLKKAKIQDITFRRKEVFFNGNSI